MRYQPTRLEVSAVLFEVVIMILTAWSFLAAPPSEVFLALLNGLGVQAGVEWMAVFAVSGACISPLALYAEKREHQQTFYRLASTPLVFFTITIVVYRLFVQSGTWTGVIVYFAVTGALWLIAATTFRDPQPRMLWKRQE